MAGVKGRSGTNKGKDKPFTDALRMEIAAAGDNHKALREIARNLLQQAMMPGKDALQAIQQVSDRLDGKPAQAIIGGDEDDPAISVVSRIEIVAASGDGEN